MRITRQLKKKGMGKLPNASHAISNTEVMKLYADKVAGRHSPMALNNAMAINLMFLGFKGCRELYNRMLGDLKIVSVDGKNELHIAKERATKTRSGEAPKVAPFGLPTLAATGNDDCPVKAFEELFDAKIAATKWFPRRLVGSLDTPHRVWPIVSRCYSACDL